MTTTVGRLTRAEPRQIGRETIASCPTWRNARRRERYGEGRK